MKKRRTFFSKDGVEYTLMVEEDIIQLHSKQIDSIKKEISNMESCDVESDRGVALYIYRQEQKDQVLTAISEILNGFSIQEILDFELIDTTFHAEHERKSNDEIIIERKWNPTKIDYEIAECLKRSYEVDQARIRFNPETKDSWEKMSFTVHGLKNKHGEPGRLVVCFENDPVEQDKTIMLITLLPVK